MYLRIQHLAQQIISAVEQRNLNALFAAIALPNRDIPPVRQYLLDHDRHTALIDLLLSGVDHPSDRTRFLTAQAMDHFADQRCAEPLRRMLGDAVPRVRWAALHSLQCEACKLAPLTSEHDTVATLIALATDDPSIKVRRVATYELGQICHDSRAIAALQRIQAEASDATVLRNAQRALKAL
jgi:HEAT repeat protein